MNIGEFLRRNGCAIALFGGLFVLGGWILYPFFASARYYARRSSCQANLKFIAMACQQYQADYDNRFPPLSDGGSRGWTLLLQRGDVRVDPTLSYEERWNLFQAGKIRLDFSCPEASGTSSLTMCDYFFNARLAARRSSSVKNPESTIAFGDGPANGSTNSHYWELPNDGDNLDSPLRRHLNGANYAFSDGHVKFFSTRSVQERIKDMRYISP